MPSDGKARLAITLDPDLVDWVEEMVDRHVFGSRSHAVERALWFFKNYVEKFEEEHGNPPP